MTAVRDGSIEGSRKFTQDDIAVWADGSWATLREVWDAEFNWKSDDYEIILEEDTTRLKEMGIIDEE